MLINEGDLRPPTEAELRAGRVQLETVWFYAHAACERLPITPPLCKPTDVEVHLRECSALSVLALIEYCKTWVVPYEAVLVVEGLNGTYLDWSHIDADRK